MDERELLALSAPAWRLAARILGRTEGAEDAVQQAYLVAVRGMRSGPPPAELRTWFLTVVANAARRHLRTEARRARREADVSREDRTTEKPEAGGLSRELVEALRSAMERLEEKYRVPVALCCEEGLSQREAAAVLEMPESTVNKYVSAGLERLREALRKSGYAAAPAVLAGGLKLTAPAMPAGLVEALQGVIKSGALPAAGAAGLALAWKLAAGASLAVVLAGGLALGIRGFGGGKGGGGAVPAVGPVIGPSSVVYAPGTEIKFTAGPTVTKVAEGKYKIDFAVSANTDVEVAVLAADGKVVRHLAAGVLGGAKPPPEPLKAGLSQSLEWDGRDDFGKPAKGEPFKVRARAGTGAKFGRFIGEDPYTFGGFESIAADEDGDVYINSAFGGDYYNQYARNVRVFDPEGRYLRTVLPFPADLPAGSMKDIAVYDGAGKAWRPRNKEQGNPSFYAHGTLVSASKKDGLTFVNILDGTISRLDVRGAVPEAAFVSGQKSRPADKNDSSILDYNETAVSPFLASDGKYLYLGRPHGDATKVGKGKVEPGVIWRMKLDGAEAMKRFVKIPATPDGPWTKEWTYPPGGASPVAGMALDPKGSLYVCDRQANRVVAFSEDGKELGEVPVRNPAQVAVHPKTGAIYVLRQKFTEGGLAEVAKFTGLGKDAAPVASLKLHSQTTATGSKMILAVKGDKTTLWITGSDTFANNGKRYPKEIGCTGMLVLEDTGNALAPAKTLFAPKDEAQNAFNRLVVDYDRDEIYGSDGVQNVWRYSGQTGAGGILKRDGKPLVIIDLTVGYDGNLYAKTGGAIEGPLERLTHELQPLPYPETGTNQLYPAIYGRFGIGYCEKGMAQGPDGRVYCMWMYDWEKYFVSGWGADGKALKGRHMTDRLKQSESVWKKIKWPDERKIEGAVIGPVNRMGGALRVDLAGNIYLGTAGVPAGYEPYPGFKKEAGAGAAVPWTIPATVGSVVKFGPEGGAWLGGEYGGAKAPEPTDPKAPKLVLDGGVTIEGGRQVYPGIGPFNGAGPSCCCRVARFDVDRYGRVVLPNGICNWAVLYDNAGNEITKFGKYGNFDSQFVPPDAKDGKPILAVPEIPLGWPTGAGFSEKSVYVNDTYNRRFVRADLTWAAEGLCDVK